MYNGLATAPGWSATFIAILNANILDLPTTKLSNVYVAFKLPGLYLRPKLRSGLVKVSSGRSSDSVTNLKRIGDPLYLAASSLIFVKYRRLILFLINSDATST